MACYVLPVLYAVFVWWFSTGVILYLDGRPRRTFRWSMLGATAVFAAAIYGIAATGADETVIGAYLAFTCGILVWGFNEIAFLMGFVTGPRSDPCPPDCRGFRHAAHAVSAILYHELAIAASAALVVAASWGAPNQVGAWTFVILWIMRLSAKLNVFLGVPNLTEEFLPDHLAYLKSFFRKRPMNALFPFSVTGGTVLIAWLAQSAAVASVPFEAAANTFLATLLALAVLEHWFLVLPISVVPLWRWKRDRLAADPSGALASAHDASGEPPPSETTAPPPALLYADPRRHPLRSQPERLRAACSR